MYLRAVLMLVVCAFAAQADKTYKPGEYELYNEVTKDLVSNNFSKAASDLDSWKAKIPESDYGGDRAVLYMKAYMGAKQWSKALDKAAEVLPQMGALFADPKDGPGQALQILFNAAVATPLVPDPTPAEAAAGEQAARQLMSFVSPSARGERCKTGPNSNRMCRRRPKPPCSPWLCCPATGP